MSKSSIVLGISVSNNNFFDKFVDIRTNSCCFSFYNWDNLSPLKIQEEPKPSIQLPLPDPDEFFQQSFDLAFPQVLAWSSAATGILLVVLILRSFTK